MLSAKARVLKDEIVERIVETVEDWRWSCSAIEGEKYSWVSVESCRSNEAALRRDVAQRLDHLARQRTALRQRADCQAATAKGLALVHQGADVRRVLVDISIHDQFAAEFRQALRKEQPGQEDTLYALLSLHTLCLKEAGSISSYLRRYELKLSAEAGIFHENGWDLPEELAAELKSQLGASCQCTLRFAVFFVGCGAPVLQPAAHTGCRHGAERQP